MHGLRRWELDPSGRPDPHDGAGRPRLERDPDRARAAGGEARRVKRHARSSSRFLARSQAPLSPAGLMVGEPGTTGTQTTRSGDEEETRHHDPTRPAWPVAARGGDHGGRSGRGLARGQRQRRNQRAAKAARRHSRRRPAAARGCSSTTISPRPTGRSWRTSGSAWRTTALRRLRVQASSIRARGRRSRPARPTGRRPRRPTRPARSKLPEKLQNAGPPGVGTFHCGPPPGAPPLQGQNQEQGQNKDQSNQSSTSRAAQLPPRDSSTTKNGVESPRRPYPSPKRTGPDVGPFAVSRRPGNRESARPEEAAPRHHVHVPPASAPRTTG